MWTPRAHAAAGPMHIRLAVLLFAVPGLAGCLAPTSLPDADGRLIYPPSVVSILIAVGLWRRRHSVSERLFLPLLILGLSFDGLGLVGSHSSSTMALVILPALLWGSHYLPRRRDFVISIGATGLIYAGALAIDAPAGVELGGQWLFTMTYLTIAAWVTHISSRRLNDLLEESREHSLVDVLTGLANRRRLMQDLDDAHAGDRYLVAIFDLNGFKAYNDRFGHLAGDELLHALGQRFSDAVDGIGHAYRLGGDEFCAILTGGAAAAPELDRVRDAFAITGSGYRIDAACGSALIPEDGTSASQVLAAADSRMYDHKRGHQARTRDLARAV
jgi:diguanylate cyclase (GGDEF)-like protein